MGFTLVVFGVVGLLAINLSFPQRKPTEVDNGQVIFQAATDKDEGAAAGRGVGNLRLILAFIVSILVLIPALYLLAFTATTQANQQWASGAVGAIVGFWLNESKTLRSD